MCRERCVVIDQSVCIPSIHILSSLPSATVVITTAVAIIAMHVVSHPAELLQPKDRTQQIRRGITGVHRQSKAAT